MGLIEDSIKNIKSSRAAMKKRSRVKKYLENNRVPWSEGYEDYKWIEIEKAIRNDSLLESFRNNQNLPGYGIGMDERLIEYPYVFSRLRKGKSVLLDAGSTFNFETIVSHPMVAEKELCIYTYHPESWNFIDRRISYDFGDLRVLPFRNAWFDEIVCISTLEHVGMDNSIYGYGEEELTHHGSGSYKMAVEELVRVLKPGGQLLMTFPFGKNINYGFFQQFDSTMLDVIRKIMDAEGKVEFTFFKYQVEGWLYSNEESCRDAESFNPHTGQGRQNDGAAHSRAICALRFIKNQ